jgi:hypothetical protein
MLDGLLAVCPVAPDRAVIECNGTQTLVGADWIAPLCLADQVALGRNVRTLGVVPGRVDDVGCQRDALAADADPWAVDHGSASVGASAERASTHVATAFA